MITAVGAGSRGRPAGLPVSAEKEACKKGDAESGKGGPKGSGAGRGSQRGTKTNGKKSADRLPACQRVAEAAETAPVRPTVECLLIYGGGDAAKTAVTYGELNAAVYALLGFAGNYLEIQNVGMDIRPDFENARLLVRGKIEIQGRVGNILLAFLRVLVYLYTVRDTINDIRQ